MKQNSVLAFVFCPLSFWSKILFTKKGSNPDIVKHFVVNNYVLRKILIFAKIRQNQERPKKVQTKPQPNSNLSFCVARALKRNVVLIFGTLPPRWRGQCFLWDLRSIFLSMNQNIFVWHPKPTGQGWDRAWRQRIRLWVNFQLLLLLLHTQRTASCMPPHPPP